MSRFLRWRGAIQKAAGELCIIVTGVLIALWADSFLERGQLREEEATHLHALRIDADAARDALLAAAVRQERQVHSLRSLLAPDVATVASIDSVDAWLYSGMWLFPAYNVPFPSLDDLESAGQLDLINDPAVRRGLMGVREDLDRLALMQADAAETQHTLVDPFVVRQFDLTQIASTSADLPAPTSTRDHGTLLHVPEVRNLIAAKLIFARDVASHVQDMLEGFQDLVLVIEARLDAIGH